MYLEETLGSEPDEVRPVRPSEPLASLPTTKTRLYCEVPVEEAMFDKIVVTSIRSDECVVDDFSAVHTIAGAADTELMRPAMKVDNSFMATTVTCKYFLFEIRQSIRPSVQKYFAMMVEFLSRDSTLITSKIVYSLSRSEREKEP